MEFDIGTFLGLVYLGTVYLYVHTRDRWNWKPGARRIGLTFVGAAIAWGALMAYDKRSFAPQIMTSAPQVITSFGGVSLGERFPDVASRYKAFNNPPSAGIPSTSDSGNLLYPMLLGDKKLAVIVEKGGVINGMVYFCDKKTSEDRTSVGGFACDQTGGEILSRYGKRVRVQCRKEKTQGAEGTSDRAFDVVEIGVRFLMLKDKVVGFYLMPPAQLAVPNGPNWGPCS